MSMDGLSLYSAMLDKDIDYTGEGTLTVAPGNIKADTTDESEKTTNPNKRLAGGKIDKIRRPIKRSCF